MAYIVKVDNREFKVDLEKDGRGFKVYLDGKERIVEVVNEKGTQVTLIIDNRSFNITLESDGQILVNNEAYSIEITDEQIQKFIKAGTKNIHEKELAIKAPMPGLIVEVFVKEGDPVNMGQSLLVVEAMKMQNEMNAPRDGIVKKVLVEKGQSVNSGDAFLVIE